VGAADLLKGVMPFEDFQVIAITSAPGRPGIAAFVNGDPRGTRDRAPGKLRVDQLVLGARCFSNEDAPPYLQGFLDGDIAEVIVYDRVLSADQRSAVETYFKQKYDGAAEAL